MKVCDDMKIKKNKEKKIKRKNNIIVKKISSFFNKIKKKLSIFEVEKTATYTFKEVIVIMLFSLGLGFFACISLKTQVPSDFCQKLLLLYLSHSPARHTHPKERSIRQRSFPHS